MTSTKPTKTSARPTRPNSSGPKTRARTIVATRTSTLPSAKDSPCQATALTVAPVSRSGLPGSVTTPAPPGTSGPASVVSGAPRPSTPGSCHRWAPAGPIEIGGSRTCPAGAPSGIIRCPGGRQEAHGVITNGGGAPSTERLELGLVTFLAVGVLAATAGAAVPSAPVVVIL